MRPWEQRREEETERTPVGRPAAASRAGGDHLACPVELYVPPWVERRVEQGRFGPNELFPIRVDGRWELTTFAASPPAEYGPGARDWPRCGWGPRCD